MGIIYEDIYEKTIDEIQSITGALQKIFPAQFNRAAEAFEELGRLALSQRGYRKTVRWDEKNRRRRLKGLPEKPCPYLRKKENIQSGMIKRR